MFVLENSKIIGMADAMTDQWEGEMLLVYIGTYPVTTWCELHDDADVIATGFLMTHGTVGQPHTGTIRLNMKKPIRPSSCTMAIKFMH